MYARLKFDHAITGEIVILNPQKIIFRVNGETITSNPDEVDVFTSTGHLIHDWGAFVADIKSFDYIDITQE